MPIDNSGPGGVTRNGGIRELNPVGVGDGQVGSPDGLVFYDTDSSGATTGLLINGTLIPIPAVVNVGTATSALTIGAGEHTSTALTAGYYSVDPDMDIYVKGSDSSALYGANLVGGGKDYKTTPASLATATGLELGSTSFSVEFWFDCRAQNATGSRIFFAGINTGGPRIDIGLGNQVSGIYLDVTLTDSTGTSIVAPGAISLSPKPLYSATLHHCVIAFNRTTGASAASIIGYIDGTQVCQYAYTDAGAALNISAATSASSLMGIGRAFGVGALLDGRVEDIKFYTNKLLTANQVQARNNAGPLRALNVDSADAFVTWWVNFQAGTATCVSGYGNALFNVVTGGATVDVRDGGIPATITDNKIYGGQPKVVNLTNTYLSVYSDSLSAGSVRLAKVA